VLLHPVLPRELGVAALDVADVPHSIDRVHLRLVPGHTPHVLRGVAAPLPVARANLRVCLVQARLVHPDAAGVLRFEFAAFLFAVVPGRFGVRVSSVQLDALGLLRFVDTPRFLAVVPHSNVVLPHLMRRDLV
jgi:hypothetical protein